MKSAKAFTLIELLVVIIIVAVLAAMLLPALASAKGNSQKINCINNLKQVGLAFRTWEASHNSRFPQAVGYASGGANEYCAHGNGTGTPMPATKARAAGMVFLVMSNQLSTPKVLFCPSDSIHTAGNGYATNFSYGDLLGLYTPGPSGVTGAEPATEISYFVNGDALEANPRDIMTGDCNIGTSGATTANSAAVYRFGQTSFLSPTVDQYQGVTPMAFNGIP